MTIKATIPDKIVAYLDLKSGDQLEWRLPSKADLKEADASLKMIRKDKPPFMESTSPGLLHPLIEEAKHRLSAGKQQPLEVMEWFDKQVPRFSMEEQKALLIWRIGYEEGATVAWKNHADFVEEFVRKQADEFRMVHARKVVDKP